MMPSAARSCMNWLTFIGKNPTAARWAPEHARSALTFPERLTPRRSCRECISRRTCRANPRNRTPTTVIVRLKVCPEKSRKVPSSLNCDCHQALSVVVSIDNAVPATSSTVTSSAHRGLVRRMVGGVKRSATAGMSRAIGAFGAVGTPIDISSPSRRPTRPSPQT